MQGKESKRGDNLSINKQINLKFHEVIDIVELLSRPLRYKRALVSTVSDDLLVLLQGDDAPAWALFSRQGVDNTLRHVHLAKTRVKYLLTDSKSCHKIMNCVFSIVHDITWFVRVS